MIQAACAELHDREGEDSKDFAGFEYPRGLCQGPERQWLRDHVVPTGHPGAIIVPMNGTIRRASGYVLGVNRIAAT